MNQRGVADLDYMTSITGAKPEEILKALEGLVFQNPKGSLEIKEQVPIRQCPTKFKEAQDAVADGKPEFEKNVEALKAVIPKDINPTDIMAPIGAPWVSADDVRAFASVLTGETPSVVVFRKSDAGWSFEHPGRGTAFTQTYGTERMPFGQLFGQLLNGRPVVVRDIVRNPDGSESSIINQPETELANQKAAEIRDKWQNWLWQDEQRRNRLHRVYNDTYNNYVDPKYDGSHLTLPGVSSLVKLRPHQSNVVWRTITDMRVLYDHVVKPGKTYAGIASFMEMKRMGQVRKPLFVVPNHLVTQWRDEFIKMYPNANVLYAQPSDFQKDKRQRLFAKILTGEYDAVIIGHSSF